MSSPYLVNARFITHRMTGVERYAYDVTCRLKERIRLIQPAGDVHGLRGHFWEQFELPRLVGRKDLLWSPANTGPLRVNNQVVTIHDTSLFDHPDWFKPEFVLLYRFLLPRLARQVVRVLTVSHFSKQRIIKVFNLPEDKVIDIYPGVDGSKFYPRSEEELAEVRNRYGISALYLLFVGTMEPRKNVERLLHTWQHIQQRYVNVQLVMVGGRGGQFREISMDKLPERVRLIGYVDDADLPALYTGALAFVMPTLYEGFGFSNLEAMACGTPVVTSNSTAIPEVVGDAGFLVNPYQVEDMVGAISQLISDADLRHAYSLKAIERARQFSYEQCTDRIWEVLQQSREYVQ